MAAKDKIELKPTTLPHIYLCDIDDSGLLREVALVKEFKDGSIYYIDVDPLHQIDKARLKKIVSGPHSDKYSLWELLAMSKLSNGMNALDFFHSNCVKVKRPKGARASAGGLADAYNVSDTMIGSDFSNPAEAMLDPTTGRFDRAGN